MSNREQFEAWFVSEYDWANDTLNTANFIGDDEAGYYIGGDYIYDGVSCAEMLFWAWRGWQANHKSLTESERYGRQADITIENLERRVEQFSSASQAALDVLFERQRQVTAEGWAPEHDDEHVEGQIADAAACYALFSSDQGHSTPAHWPWSPDWWKQSGARRDLVKAGALILAEIERIDRASANGQEAK